MDRRKFLLKTTLGTAGLLLNNTCLYKKEKQRPNVLFFAVDDLRPEINCFGRKHIVSPNLDKLASEGIIFTNHYVHAPTCGASRASMLTGKYPDFKIPQTLSNTAPELIPKNSPDESTSLPHHFRRSGYTTVCIGKISHDPESVDLKDKSGETIHWDRAYGVAAEWGNAWNAFFAYSGGKTRIPTKTPAWENADVPDDGYPDGLTAQEAIKNLQELKQSGNPFFLGVGFYKPHLPFNSPKKYWDLYEHNKIKLAKNTKPPDNIDSKISLHKSDELTPRYTGLATPGKVTTEEAKILRHAYFACVSYIDVQIGKVLKEVDRLGLRENTIIVVWGDHGWHLGDLSIWGKHTVFEVALNSPLFIRAPQLSQFKGEQISNIIETVDIYPTLCELCDLDIPPNLDGDGLLSQMMKKDRVTKGRALGFWQRKDCFVLSMRTDHYRISKWFHKETGALCQTELYDQHLDPDETKNIAQENPDLVKKLLTRMETE